MGDEFNANNSMDYFYFAGSRFLIEKGVLKDVQVESEVVRIPDTVTEIRRSAFLEARLLGRMEALVIPSSVKKIERLSFAGLANLRLVEMQAGIVTLEQGMFRNCMDLEFVHLPDTLRTIESRAFENCLKLRTIELPKVWVQMAEDAFLNCVNLKDRRIDNAVEDAQYRRKKEEEEVRRAKFPHLYRKEAEKKKPEEKEVLLAEGPKQSQEVPVVPAEKSVAEELLEAALMAEQQVFDAGSVPQEPPKEETKDARFFIHEGVLERCEIQGDTIKIPEGVTALADRLFYGNKELEKIVFPSTLTYIGDQALEGTGWLEIQRERSNYVIVNGILVSAYYDSMITEAKLPDTVWRIAPYAFYKSGAQLVVLPESVREIDARAFVDAEITEIDFSPRADVALHTPLAVRCDKLRELYFQGKVERLEENFVEDCPALKRVCLKWAQTVVNRNAFDENVRIWVL